MPWRCPSVCTTPRYTGVNCSTPDQRQGKRPAAEETVRMVHTRKTLAVLLSALATLGGGAAQAAVEEIGVGGEPRETPAGPASVLTPADLAGATLATTEDLVKFEPGVVVRRRFVGDA